MYAIGFVNAGAKGMLPASGGYGFKKLRNRTLRGWKSECRVMRSACDEILIVPEWTEEMTTCSPRVLYSICQTTMIGRM